MKYTTTVRTHYRNLHCLWSSIQLVLDIQTDSNTGHKPDLEYFEFWFVSPPSNDWGFHFTKNSKSLWKSLNQRMIESSLGMCSSALILDDASGFILIGCWLSFLLSKRVASTQTGQRNVFREVRKAFSTCRKIYQAKFRYSVFFSSVY